MKMWLLAALFALCGSRVFAEVPQEGLAAGSQPAAITDQAVKDVKVAKKQKKPRKKRAKKAKALEKAEKAAEQPQ